jgi:hypothetical protein
MTSAFDGMTGVLNEVFGSPVVLTRQGDGPVTVTAVFREMPVEDDVADGRSVVTMMPTLRLRKTDGDLAKGDLVAPGNGKTYVVLRPIQTASPASDAFVFYPLEEVQA